MGRRGDHAVGYNIGTDFRRHVVCGCFGASKERLGKGHHADYIKPGGTCAGPLVVLKKMLLCFWRQRLGVFGAISVGGSNDLSVGHPFCVSSYDSFFHCHRDLSKKETNFLIEVVSFAFSSALELDESHRTLFFYVWLVEKDAV